MTTKTVSPEQLEKLKQLKQRWDGLTKHLGELHYNKRLLEEEIEATNAAIDDFNKEQMAISQEIEKEFGSTGTVDLVTGEFVSDNP